MGASTLVLGMPLGRHALSVECLKPWTVAAEHSVGTTNFSPVTIKGIRRWVLTWIDTPDSGQGFATGKTRAKR